MLRFFRGLRGKLTLTYTLVTVLALLALELLALLAVVAFLGLTKGNLSSYLADVFATLNPQARQYLQPGREDLPGLQAWLERVHASGYASLEPQHWFDSPAAPIVPGSPMLVLSPEGAVLAQAPPGGESLVGQAYSPSASGGGEVILERALAGESSVLRLHEVAPEGHYQLAVPVTRGDWRSPRLGVILLSVQPPPPLLLSIWPALLGGLLATAVVLLAGVAPFGALFGFIMARRLTRRLHTLSAAVNAWSEGDFSVQPQDRSRDEISELAHRMRHMAERIQNLLQTQQELAMLVERNRLARELHDTVKQLTFATLMQLRAARNLLPQDPAAAGKHLEEAESLARSSQQELGAIIAELRPAALDGKGLAGALRVYLEGWSRRTRIPARFQVHDEGRLSLEVEQALYRVAQEALANVARHSRASEVAVQLSYQQGQVCLAVVDNGVGFDPRAAGQQGFGLRSMGERLAALGGRLEVESSPGGGTALSASAPAE